jgi:hypothetical protein
VDGNSRRVHPSENLLEGRSAIRGIYQYKGQKTKLGITVMEEVSEGASLGDSAQNGGNSG